MAAAAAAASPASVRSSPVPTCAVAREGHGSALQAPWYGGTGQMVGITAMASRLRSGALGLVVLAGALLLAEAACADAIDGQWCYPDGRRFSIRGPEIVTPAGTRMRGN